MRTGYSGRILPITEDSALAWGRIGAIRTRGVPDGLIAATPLIHDLAVVTPNIADFADTGVRIVNPWTA